MYVCLFVCVSVYGGREEKRKREEKEGKKESEGKKRKKEERKYRRVELRKRKK